MVLIIQPRRTGKHLRKSDQITNCYKIFNFINPTNVNFIRSPDRDKALQLCGWRFEKDTNAPYNNLFLERLEREGAYPRATAISVFNLCLRQAIEILNRGASKMTLATNLNIVAMALSGFSEDKNSMWRELCLKSRSQLSDPYLRATFAFLTADNDSYESVLVSGIFSMY